MKLWNVRGEKVCSPIQILNSWPEGVYYVLIESREDIRVVRLLQKHFGGTEYIRDILETGEGLYVRGDWNRFYWTAPLLEGLDNG